MTTSEFAIPEGRAYIRLMPRKVIELPPAVALRFVEDMRAYFAEKNWIKADEIAARQLHALRAYQRHEAHGRERDVPTNEGLQLMAYKRRGSG